MSILATALLHAALAAAPDDGTVRIVANDDGFVAPARVPAGLRHVAFANRGSAIHEAMFVRLPPGMDAAGFVAAVQRGDLFPDGAIDHSGPGLTSPGESTEVWTRLEPGDYVVVCWNHTRSTQPAALRVVADGAHDDTPPEPDAVVRLVDYRFELSAPIRSGVRTLRIETPGPSMHEVDLYRLLDGSDVDDLLRWRKADREGATPAIALGGALDSHDIAATKWLRRNFLPGRYALHCEMPMAQDAQAGTQYATHADAGMVLPFEVRD